MRNKVTQNRTRIPRAARQAWREMRGRVAHRQRYRLVSQGWQYVGAMAIIGFAAWHSGTNLVYLVFSAMVAAFVGHGFIVGVSLMALEVKRSLPHHAQADNPVSIRLTLTNRRWFLSSYGVRITDHLSNGKPVGAAFFFRVDTKSSAETDYTITFPLRGVYKLDRLEVASRFPFGMVERYFIEKQPQELVVFPQIVEVTDLLTRLESYQGDQSAHEKGAGLDLFGIRSYNEGEHARRIHWKSTARTQRLMVMEFDRDEQPKTTLILRNLVTPEMQSDPDVARNFEIAIVAAASLASRIIKSNKEASLLTSQGVIDAGRGPEHLNRILHALARLELVTTAKRWPANELDRKSIVEIRFRDWQSGEGSLADMEVDSRNHEIHGGKLLPRGGSADAASPSAPRGGRRAA